MEDRQTDIKTNVDVDTPKKKNAGKGGAGGFTLPPRETQEAKTRRVQAVFKPSVYDEFASKVKAKGYSVNDVLNRLVEDFIKRVE